MDSVDRLAKTIAALHKANQNPPSTAPRVGKVVSVSPMKIQYGESIVLESRHLVISEDLMPEYKRTVELTSVELSGLDDSHPIRIDFRLPDGTIEQRRVTKLTIPPIDNPDSEENKMKATITFTDGLKEGDKVILQPDENLKQWFVTARVWKEDSE